MVSIDWLEKSWRYLVLISSSHKVLFYLLVSFIISGVFQGIFPHSQDNYFLLHTLLIAFLLFLWCGRHAEENDIVPHSGTRALCALIGVIGVAFYLFNSFGLKSGGVKFLHGIAFTIVVYLAYEIAFYLTRILVYWI